MRKLKVGVIGTGMAFERLHYPAYQQLSDRFEIVALCDTEVQRARKWAGLLHLDPNSVYEDFQQMLDRDDLDIVDIMVPIRLNYMVTEAVSRRLAGRKKGIICEKPLAATLEEANSARRLARKYGLPVMIAENFRYNQEIDMIRDLVRTTRIGEVFYFMQNRVVDFWGDAQKGNFPATEWRQHPDFPGGAIMDTGVHDMAGLRHIFGAIERLQAFGKPQEADYAPYSVICVNLFFKSGVIGQYSFFCSGREMQRPLAGLRIFGSLGMVYLEERDAGTVNLALNDGRTEKIAYEVQKGFYNELLNFYNALIGTEPVSVTPEMEYGDLKTVLDILRSIREERIVCVDEDAVYRPDYSGREWEHPLQ